MVLSRIYYRTVTVADPGFAVGADSRGGYASKILYVEMKESGTLGGGLRRGSPARSADETCRGII